jgi:prepilin-type N-terminal cleavage/methylation domain-containing protein
MRAFSLIEVMIASAMLGVGLAALMTAYGQATSLESHQERVTAALHLAEGHLENLLLRYPDSPDLSASTHPTLGFTADGTPTASAPFFNLTWTVSPGPIPRTRRIDVTVTWTEPRGPQTLSLSTHRS